MLSLATHNLGHRFAGPWLYRGLTCTVPAGGTLCVLGPNGSGKSTFLRIVAGQLAPAEGTLILSDPAGAVLPADRRYQHIGWAAPGLELYGPLTVDETIHLHLRLRTCWLPGGSAELLDLLALRPHRDKPLRHLSSGMQQRLLLGLALFTEGKLLLLDEPTSHMDSAWATRCLDWLTDHQRQRTLLVASNLPREAERFPQQLALTPAQQ